VNLGGEGLTNKLWQALVVVVVFALTLRLASAYVEPAIGAVLWLLVVVSIYAVIFRHRR